MIWHAKSPVTRVISRLLFNANLFKLKHVLNRLRCRVSNLAWLLLRLINIGTNLYRFANDRMCLFSRLKSAVGYLLVRLLLILARTLVRLLNELRNRSSRLWYRSRLRLTCVLYPIRLLRNVLMMRRSPF